MAVEIARSFTETVAALQLEDDGYRAVITGFCVHRANSGIPYQPHWILMALGRQPLADDRGVGIERVHLDGVNDEALVRQHVIKSTDFAATGVGKFRPDFRFGSRAEGILEL